MITSNIRVYGIVQGVGFRPFVSRICLENNIKGTVSNKGSYVEIFAQGENVSNLFDALNHYPPERSMILNIISKETELPAFDSFEIIESEKDTGDIFISPDIAICDKCKEELYDPGNRRYLHPFINCTNCGPRLTILDSMPYDRVRTSMKDFEMCPDCEYEYTHPETRRYDAQPVCCPNCGPKPYLLMKKELMKQYSLPDIPDTDEDKLIITDIRDREAISMTRRAISEGKIAAIKGIGGFHLCCDARNEEAVSRLRLLKNRPMKPFAVMMKDEETVKKECTIKCDEMYEYLTGYQKPIILFEKSGSSTLAPSIAPDNPYVGVMLPYTPIHLLLFNYEAEDDYKISDCLVMTSANVSGAPICRTDEDVINEISDFTDIVLSNNRLIRTRADDSVMDFTDNKPYMIRRSRGFAPLPIMIGKTSSSSERSHDFKGHVLAMGGELKNTFAIAKDSLIYPSAYIGDMADIRSVDALTESVKRMTEMLEAEPSLVVCDMHPKYNTTAVAESMGLPVMKIQHHYAHILSCMAENDYLDEVIGVSFDGTGYGMDGTIWGGEYLRCRLDGFDRLDHISPFIQSGGDLSSKEGWRIAASILGDFAGESSEESCDKAKDICSSLEICSSMEYSILNNMARTGVNSILSTSAGRLFDAVSAVLGIRRSSTFEGESSTALMFEAERWLRRNNRSITDYLDNETEHITTDYIKSINLDTNLLVCDLTQKALEGEDRSSLAFTFHAALSDIINQTCQRLSNETGIGTIALSGGVFQNRLLLKLTKERLKKTGLKVLHHSLIPTNDGGIAAGQALAGLIRINQIK